MNVLRIFLLRPFEVNRSRFASHVASTFLTQGLTLVFGVVTAGLLARWLGPEGKGVIALALLLPQMLGLFLGLGINVANVYLLSSKELDVAEVLGNTLTFAGLVTCGGMLIASTLIATGWIDHLVPGVPTHLWAVTFCVFPLSLLSTYLNGIIQGMQRITSLNIVSLFGSVLDLVLTLLFVVGLRTGVVGAVLIYFCGSAVDVLLLMRILRKAGVKVGLRWEYSTIRIMLSYGLRAYIGNVIHFFNYRLDTLIVNIFLNPIQVGLYTVSVRLAELLWIFPRSVAFVIFPKAAATDGKTMNHFTPRVFFITFGMTLLGGLSLALIGKLFIGIVFGSAFVGAYEPLLWLLPGAVFLGSTKVLTSEIAGRGHPQYNSISAGIAFIVTVILDIYLIPRYGIMGASIASSAAYMVVSVFSVFFYLRVSRRKPGLTTQRNTLR